MDYGQFVYTQFRLNDDQRTVQFEYRLRHRGQEYTLTEMLVFPVPLLDTPEQRRSLRALHLALGISYYKIFLPPTIAHPYVMDQAEADFWNDIWHHGLGEFLYVNKLSADRLAAFSPQAGIDYPGETAVTARGALLGIGGGKDSIVAGELLKQLRVPLRGFVMATGEQLGQTAAVAGAMGIELLAINRRIDKRLLELQERPGAYRGHIPISLIFGLAGSALAIASQAAYVVVANEASASIPRILANDLAVNHQWSKSLGFEAQLQRFVRGVDKRVTYFSAIRQLTSVGVAKLFAAYPRYFEVFTSDNFVFRIDPARRPSGRWSLESPKSLSSYLLLAPWLNDEDMKRIFTIDFLNQPPLEPLFLGLTGVEGEPPLDCVGTVEELVLSVNLLTQDSRYTDSLLMELARQRGVIRDDDWNARLRTMLQLQTAEALPDELQKPITRLLREYLAS